MAISLVQTLGRLNFTFDQSPVGSLDSHQNSRRIDRRRRRWRRTWRPWWRSLNGCPRDCATTSRPMRRGRRFDTRAISPLFRIRGSEHQRNVPPDASSALTRLSSCVLGRSIDCRQRRRRWRLVTRWRHCCARLREWRSYEEAEPCRT